MTAPSQGGLARDGSLFRRLLITAASSALALLVMGALALTFLFRATVLTQLDARLDQAAIAVIGGIAAEGDGDIGVDASAGADFERAFSGRYWQVNAADGDRSGAALATSGSLFDARLELPAALVARSLSMNGQPVSGDAAGPQGEPLRIVVRAVRLAPDAPPLLIAAAEDRREADGRVARFALAAAGLFALFALLLAAGILLQVRIGLAPVLRMREALADVRAGGADRLEGGYPDELLPLARELNALLDHSGRVVERARTHVGNLAHALRTPLTVLSNAVREEEGPGAELARRQIEQMRAQIDHHLRRARAAASAQGLAARTPVDACVEDLARTLARIHAARKLRVDTTIAPGLVFRGERQDLDDLVGNLMDNACKWAAARVRVTADADVPGRLRIEIDDDGPGVPADQRAQVLERGVRLDERTPGTGLGLSIVADLARAYDGTLEFGVSELGGLRARLLLPAARQIPETLR